MRSPSAAVPRSLDRVGNERTCNGYHVFLFKGIKWLNVYITCKLKDCLKHRRLIPLVIFLFGWLFWRVFLQTGGVTWRLQVITLVVDKLQGNNEKNMTTNSSYRIINKWSPKWSGPPNYFTFLRHDVYCIPLPEIIHSYLEFHFGPHLFSKFVWESYYTPFHKQHLARPTKACWWTTAHRKSRIHITEIMAPSPNISGT